jgi:sugar transferase (PEP-CTERM system associated)
VARPRGVFVAAELTLLTAAVLQTAWARGTLEAPIVIALCGLFFHMKALDKSLVEAEPLAFFRDVFQALAFALASSVVLFYFFPALASRAEAALPGAFLAGVMPVMLRPMVQHLVRRKKLVEGILIVGAGELAEKLCRALGSRTASARNERGLLHFPESLATREDAVDLTRLQEIVSSERISRVVVAEQDDLHRAKIEAALVDPRMRGLQVNNALDFYEQHFGKVWVDGLSSDWFVYSQGFKFSKAGQFIKRGFDVFASVLMLVLGAPLFALIAIATKLDSKGPILFRQTRVGCHGKTFEIYKFRSMREDAEAKIGPAWATDYDPRVTRVGRFLRKFRLDELPQAINVLRGEMSMVGPRPERPFFVERLSEVIPFYDMRHYAKPGITGWAQVMYAYGASVEDSHQKLQFDLHYVKHQSLLCDLKILCKTVKVVLFGKGR